MRTSLAQLARLGTVVGASLLIAGAGLFGYRYAMRPVTLTVAAGSIDGDAVRTMSALAGKINSSNATVRLKVVDAQTALGAAAALATGQADLAIVRSDLGDLSAGRSIVILTHAVVLLIAPVGSPVKAVDDLKGKTLGVVGGPINRPVAEMLIKSFDLGRAGVQIKDLMPGEVRPALQGKQVQAVLAVVPITERYVTALRSFMTDGKRQPTLIAIESAEAIAAVEKAYESHDLPKGTIKGSPAIPDEDLTTLRVPVHLVARKSLDNDTASALAKALMESRRELISEFPLVSQISAPGTDKDENIPIHPGAKAYFEGEEKSFFDKYGDQFFYGSILLGSLASLLAGIWNFVLGGSSKPGGQLVRRLNELTARIRAAKSEQELQAIDDEINTLLNSDLAALVQDNSQDAALNVATERLERLLHQQGDRLRAGFKPGEAPAA
jgi:TRAP transporter TAXI family solute receptor